MFVALNKCLSNGVIWYKFKHISRLDFLNSTCLREVSGLESARVKWTVISNYSKLNTY